MIRRTLTALTIAFALILGWTVPAQAAVQNFPDRWQAAGSGFNTTAFDTYLATHFGAWQTWCVTAKGNGVVGVRLSTNLDHTDLNYFYSTGFSTVCRSAYMSGYGPLTITVTSAGGTGAWIRKVESS